mmetsp:Transcript_15305/g.16976  ORF Transcript_15305/g.16976 Transcript_15305/m.16976 type:complete len:405 (-) Transcript_15305:227-1441(-)
MKVRKDKKRRRKKSRDFVRDDNNKRARIIPSLYEEDLGTEGVKKKKTDLKYSRRHSISDFRVTKKENKRRNQRQSRFSNDLSTSSNYDSDGVVDNSFVRLSRGLSSSRTSSHGGGGSNLCSSSSEQVVGTCTNLEKSYFRLTTFPKAENIRPLAVLQKSLEHIKKRYVKKQDFEWANDQLKAVRQDITVQGIQNNFCLEVYETHARILLEHGDLSEFNQCQSMIRSLTSSAALAQRQNNYGKKEMEQTLEQRDEFRAYQLLYSLAQNSWTDLTASLAWDNRENNKNIEERGPSCEHAMSVIKSIINHDYRSFFKLYDSAPHLSPYLMDFFIHRVRKDAYDRIVSSYRPTMDLNFFQETLYFGSLKETKNFLKKNKVVFVKKDGGIFIDCKASSDKLREGVLNKK